MGREMQVQMPATFALPYSRLAADYDATMGVPFFRQTRDFFERVVKRYRIRFRSAADIGCGTGLFARYLTISRRISVFGVDLSAPMLRIAKRNCCGTNVILMRQDIRCLRLPRPVDLITANFDTLNHIVRTNDLRQALGRIFENLNPGGHFIFDLVTDCLPFGGLHFYVRRFNRSRRSVTQTVRVDPIRKLISILVTISSPDMIKPIIERHCERAYSPKELGRALLEAGFTIRGIHDAATLVPVKECPPRVVVVARKDGNEHAFARLADGVRTKCTFEQMKA
jgi:SAM-dependent methyltransferase